MASARLRQRRHQRRHRHRQIDCPGRDPGRHGRAFPESGRCKQRKRRRNHPPDPAPDRNRHVRQRRREVGGVGDGEVG